MSSQTRPPTAIELEHALANLDDHHLFPPTPDLARAVRLRIAASPPRGARPVWWLALSPRRVLATAAIVLVVLSAAMLAIYPNLRETVADRLGLPGVGIFFTDETPTPPPPVGGDLDLGVRLSLDQVRERTTFPVHVPALAGFDAPDEVYRSALPTEMVSFVYLLGPTLPESNYTGVGALLTQFQGDTKRDFILKGIVTDPTRQAGDLELLTVNGGRGYWIEGAPHYFMYVDPDGQIREESTRLASNVLLWQQDGLTFRLEADISKEEALRIAASVQPPDV